MFAKMASFMSILHSVSNALTMDIGTIRNVSVIMATMLLIILLVWYAPQHPLIIKVLLSATVLQIIIGT